MLVLSRDGSYIPIGRTKQYMHALVSLLSYSMPKTKLFPQTTVSEMNSCANLTFTLSIIQTLSYASDVDAFENIVGNGEIVQNEQFIHLSQTFLNSILSLKEISICFRLDNSKFVYCKIVVCGKRLKAFRVFEIYEYASHCCPSPNQISCMQTLLGIKSRQT